MRDFSRVEMQLSKEDMNKVMSFLDQMAPNTKFSRKELLGRLFMHLLSRKKPEVAAEAIFQKQPPLKIGRAKEYVENVKQHISESPILSSDKSALDEAFYATHGINESRTKGHRKQVSIKQIDDIDVSNLQKRFITELNKKNLIMPTKMLKHFKRLYGNTTHGLMEFRTKGVLPDQGPSRDNLVSVLEDFVSQKRSYEQ